MDGNLSYSGLRLKIPELAHDPIQIRFSTGFVLLISDEDFPEDFDHLLRNLIAEHFIPTMRHDTDVEAAVKNLANGTHYLISQLGIRELRELGAMLILDRCDQMLEPTISDFLRGQGQIVRPTQHDHN